MLQPAGHRDPAELHRFADDSGALGAAFDASASPYLAAYPGQAWPVALVRRYRWRRVRSRSASVT